MASGRQALACRSVQPAFVDATRDCILRTRSSEISSDVPVDPDTREARLSQSRKSDPADNFTERVKLLSLRISNPGKAPCRFARTRLAIADQSRDLCDILSSYRPPRNAAENRFTEADHFAKEACFAKEDCSAKESRYFKEACFAPDRYLLIPVGPIGAASADRVAIVRSQRPGVSGRG